MGRGQEQVEHKAALVRTPSGPCVCWDSGKLAPIRMQSKQPCQLPHFADETPEAQREGVICLHISLELFVAELGAMGVVV